ncbi:MAG TPA: thiamine diphosphokinase [Bacillota bacterium]|nr:thiamine diphosphokinase [Bacillota bacterium]
MTWYIIANGKMQDYEFFNRLTAGSSLICADGGANHAFRMGRVPSVVIGDLDSLGTEVRAWLEGEGVPVITAPREKDETDTGLALQWLVREHPDVKEVTVLGALGGRLDHTVFNLQLLLTWYRQRLKIKLVDEAQTVFLITPEWPGHFTGLGRLVSLLAFTPEVEGISTVNLQYSLSDARMYQDKPLGVSNVLTGETGEVTVRAGVLLAFINH